MLNLIKKQQNLIIQLLVKGLALSLGIFTIRWVNARLTVFERGQLEDILSVCAIFLALTGFGISQLLYKAYSQKTQNLADYWATVNILKIGLYFVSIPFLYLVFSFSKITDWWFLFGTFTAQYILATDLHFKSVSDTNGRSKFYSISDLCGKASSIILLYGGVWFGMQVFGSATTIYVWAFILANLLTLVLDFYFQKDSTKWGKFRLDYLRLEASNIFICVLTSLFMTGYLKTLSLFMEGSILKGSYGNSQKIFDLWCVIPAITIPVLVSKMHNNLKQFPENKNKIFAKNIALVLSLGIFMFAFSNLTADLLNQLIGATKYVETVGIFRIQSVALVIYPFLYFFGSYFLIINKIKYDLFISVIVGFFTLGSMFLLNQLIGYNGLIIGLTLAYFGDFTVKTILFARNYNKTIN